MSAENPAGVDRRTLLKRGAIATGAATVAPQILRASVAGAQTTICHAVKYEPNCAALGPSLDPSCPAAMNNEIAAALGGAPNQGCPAPITVSGVNTATGTITVTDPACEIRFVGFKAGNEGPSNGGCYWRGPNGPGQSGNDPGAVVTLTPTSATIASPLHDISHITVVVCCTASVV